MKNSEDRSILINNIVDRLKKLSTDVIKKHLLLVQREPIEQARPVPKEKPMQVDSRKPVTTQNPMLSREEQTRQNIFYGINELGGW